MFFSLWMISDIVSSLVSTDLPNALKLFTETSKLWLTWKNKTRNGKLISITLSHAHWRCPKKTEHIGDSRCSPHYHICAPYDMIYRQSCDNLHLDGLIHVAYWGGFAEPALLITERVVLLKQCVLQSAQGEANSYNQRLFLVILNLSFRITVALILNLSLLEILNKADKQMAWVNGTEKHIMQELGWMDMLPAQSWTV